MLYLIMTHEDQRERKRASQFIKRVRYEQTFDAITVEEIEHNRGLSPASE